MNDKPKRRIVVPNAKPSQIVTSNIIPAAELLLHDSKCILAAELANYRAKVSKGITLDLREARIVQGYVDVLLKMCKDEREASRAEDLSNLSDEELLDLATKVLHSTPKTIPAE